MESPICYVKTITQRCSLLHVHCRYTVITYELWYTNCPHVEVGCAEESGVRGFRDYDLPDNLNLGRQCRQRNGVWLLSLGAGG